MSTFKLQRWTAPPEPAVGQVWRSAGGRALRVVDLQPTGRGMTVVFYAVETGTGEFAAVPSCVRGLREWRAKLRRERRELAA